MIIFFEKMGFLEKISATQAEYLLNQWDIKKQKSIKDYRKIHSGIIMSITT